MVSVWGAVGCFGLPARAADGADVIHRLEADNAFCLTASADGRHWGLKTVHAEGVRAWIDGEIIVELGEMLDLGCPRFATQGDSWSVEFGFGGEKCLFVNGVRYGPFADIDTFSPRTSADGLSWAAEVQTEAGVAVIVDGETKGPFDDAGFFHYAPEGHRYTFIATDGEGRWVVTDDGRWGPFEVVGQTRFSKDGRHWGGVVTDERGAFVLVDGVLHGPWATVTDVTLEGGIWRAVVSVDERQHVVMDGEVLDLGADAEVIQVVFGAGGQAWGCCYRLEDGHGVIIDGRVCGEGFARPVTPIFSGDGGAWAYAGVKADGARVESDRGTWGPFEEILPPRLSPEGAHLAFWLREGQQYFAMVDGQRFGPFDDVFYGEETRGGRREYPFVFSGDDARWAVLAERGSKTVVLIDGEEHGPHGAAGGFVFGAGGRWGYWLMRGLEAHAVIDGVEYGSYDEVGEVVFSADGASWGFVGYREGRGHPVLDGHDWGPLDHVNWISSADGGGGELAFTGRDGEKTKYVFAAGAKLGPYLEVSPVRALPGGGVAFFALRRGEMPGSFDVVHVGQR